MPSCIPVIVRVAKNTALAIGNALDAGADGVMVPMIETAAGLSNAPAIAEIKSLDMIFIGSGDLSANSPA